MHFEILVEDQSGQKALEILVARIVGEGHTFKIHGYKGAGRIPRGLGDGSDPGKRILLERLPKLLQGYGKAFANYPPDSPATVIVVCDLDDRCLKRFRQELDTVLANCHPAPPTCFCLAIEEGEAWLLGDLRAIRAAYPKAKQEVLTGYVNDSICGTWEKLADAVFPGGAVQLARQGWQAIGAEKFRWAQQIASHMDVDDNQSPSFCRFRNTLRERLHPAIQG